jgi:GDPmannose 4,6-dehydratase
VSTVDLNEPKYLAEVVRKVRPHEIYHLAAHHFSSQNIDNNRSHLEPFVSVNLMAANTLLEILKQDLSESRFFYASSAHIFGVPATCPQTEMTLHRPDSPYAITKSAGVYLCRYFRESHSVYASVGILYNHESPRRPDSFVTNQIARTVALAFSGDKKPLVIRDLDAIVDWGAAQDYVVAMWLTLQQPFGDEYIISSGKPHTIREFVNEACGYLGIPADDLIIQNPKAKHVEHLPYVGDCSKIRTICGWKPRMSFRDLVRTMVDHQLRLMDMSSSSPMNMIT